MRENLPVLVVGLAGKIFVVSILAKITRAIVVGIHRIRENTIQRNNKSYRAEFIENIFYLQWKDECQKFIVIKVD